MRNKIKYFIFAISLTLLGPVSPSAQDMRGLNVTSDAFTKSEMTRESIVGSLAKLAPGVILDLSGRSLNGLDLSGLDLR